MGAAELTERIQRLTAELKRQPDPTLRRLAEDLAASVLELHGEGLERLLAALDDDTRERLADDGVVSSLLMIHGLHPVPVEKRVLQALDQVRPYMESHGGNVELLGVEDGVVRLRLVGSCDGCAASSSTLELAVEKAIQEEAPDVLGMIVEGAAEAPLPGVTGTPLPLATGKGNGAPAALDDWLALDGVDDLSEDESRLVTVGQERLLVARVETGLLAYRDACKACGSSLEEAELREGVLACQACGRAYFLARAGRSLDGDRIQLDPVPLLADPRFGARVALPS
jgi:Fe-S cluster biogenesis protein NfuA/nitrite reductase/ring-hydroxylating ferredoxin subunit